MAPKETENFLKWFVAFRDPREIWENHPSFLVGEIVFYILALLTLKHALRMGGRYPWMWLTTILHGLTVESVSYFVPDIDNFWHAQGMIMFLGKRLPLYVMLVYPVFLYTAGASVARLHLKPWVEPFAMGLGVVLIDVPFDIMGIKLLWWTWHDTDPNIYDRHYWVPWTSYYFHASFASSFCFLFHGTRRWMSTASKFTKDSLIIELMCALVTGLFSMPMGILQFLPLYHPLHDNLHIHTEVCVFIILTIYALIVWSGDRNPPKEARAEPNKGWFDELSMHAWLHFPLYIILACVSKPENIRATGLHEPVGDCDKVSPVQTAFGQVLSKKTYLCMSGYHEDYYDFTCVKDKDKPKAGDDWYTVCGTPFGNQIEYIIVVTMFSLLGLYIYMQWLSCSGRQPKPQKTVAKARGKRD